MKPEKVIIEESSILEWTLNNDKFINNLLYENVFPFVESDKTSVSILRIYSFYDKDEDGMDVVTDFTITKSQIKGTIQKLLKAYERYEEYEKCDKLLKLQKSLVEQ